MATLTLKNVPDDLAARLKEEAARNRRSLNQEAIARLASTARRRRTPEEIERIIEESRAAREQFRGRIWVTDEDLDEMINAGRP